MTLPRLLLMLLRICAAIQVVVGVALWTGHWYAVVNMHRDVGFLFVMVLWFIALLAFVAQRAKGLAIVAFLWGAVILWLGMTQQVLFPGELHWIVRTVHLLIGLGAIPIGARLSRAVAGSPEAPETLSA